MKMRNLLQTLVLLSAFILPHVNAATVYGGGNQLAMYYPVGGAVYFKFKPTGDAMINPAACTDNYYYVVPESHVQYEEYKKIILTAIASGKTVGVYLNDDKCAGPYPDVYSMWING